eukprot:g47722.t1
MLALAAWVPLISHLCFFVSHSLSHSLTLLQMLALAAWVPLISVAVALSELFAVFLCDHIVATLILSPREREQRLGCRESIASLRKESNTVNSPATFVQYAKLQRKLIKLTKLQTDIEEKLAAGAWSKGVLLCTYGPLVCVTLLALYHSLHSHPDDLFLDFAPFPFSLLISLSPFRWLSGHVAPLVWMLINMRACAFLRLAVREPHVGVAATDLRADATSSDAAAMDGFRHH